ncbi:sodium:solute symporter family transporter [Novipirellula rosea]|uniref:Sodium:solute symporter n=1 Tax=Novipirellula rosea TaxID=1031540 RepID=A0ABP8M4S2_9BACT
MSELQVRWLDYAAIFLYLGAMAAMAVYFARRNTNTEEYFVGNRGFSGWVIGLSMLGTIVSSATFLALPAAAYALDWRQLAVNLALPFVAVIAVLVFIPLFRQGKMTTAFEYLGMRYGMVPRLYGTFSFIVMQLIRSAQVLFLLALPIQFLTGAPLGIVIVGAGIFVAFYTVIGGIDTVIWTDVVQTVVLFCGGIACASAIIVELPGGISQVIEIGTAQNKFSFGSFDWDLSQRTFWTVAMLGVVNWLAIYGGDQNIVQRYVSAKSTREARKATIIYSSLALPMWAFFFFVGTSVFAYYQTFPDPAVAALQADQVLPFFILNHIPAGLAGLIVAAIIAAAMSTLDSSLNAIATVTVVDLMKPLLARDRSDRFYLVAARVIATAAAVLMILGGLIFANLPKESMNDISLIVTSIFGGCLMGLFMVGFFTERVDGLSATCALLAAVVFNVYLGLGALQVLPVDYRLPVHSYWTGALVNFTFIVFAYVTARVRNRAPRDLAGLTVWTLNVNLKQK